MRLFALSALLCAIFGVASAQPPLEAYGGLPNIDRMAISPDGKHLAYVLRDEENEGLFIFNISTGEISGGVKIERGKVRRVMFAGPDHVVLLAQVTSTRGGIGRYKYEYSSAASYNILTKGLALLLQNSREMVFGQSGIGRIIGLSENGSEVFMPAFGYNGWETIVYKVFRVNLDTGEGKSEQEGGMSAVDWFVDPSGAVIAREDFRNDFYTIRAKEGEEWREIYSVHTKKPTFFIYGVKPDKTALVGLDDPEDSGYANIFELSFDGVRSPPIFTRDDAEVDEIISDINQVVIGVEYSGLYPSYEFYDPELTKIVSGVAASFRGSSVHLTGYTEDFSRLLFVVSGGRKAPGYYLYTRADGSLLKIANMYEQIDDKDVGDILTIEYGARDGMRIPAIVSLPPWVGELNKLPLIVMPHGGPETYDQVNFNWMAQYFASRGYLVFQPNFRGSGGFGAEFRNAGFGEWGGKMQDDITDGVNLLVRNGWVDKDRICIVGGSYGGYAALAGGAFTPDLYKCVAAIAPISDVQELLKELKRDSGSRSLIFDYWQTFIGNLRTDSDKLYAISPANFAANFEAPVLLLHGLDDSVVPIDQSQKMAKALSSAGKQVRYVELQGEDHWLSLGPTRLEALRELDRFVDEAIGAH